MRLPILAAAALGAQLSAPLYALDLSISVTNLTHGSHFTPLLVAAHGPDQRLFEVGEAASAGLQAMAEGGDLSGLVNNLAATAADVAENPAAGLLPPGGSTSLEMTTNDGNGYLSVVAMILPSNDAFVGLNAYSLPTEPGRYVVYVNAYDAGTEANDEIINGAGAPGAAGVPADPLGRAGKNGAGVTATEDNQRVHIHRGVLGDTDPQGGPSDLDSRVHRWLNPVARVTIEVR